MAHLRASLALAAILASLPTSLPAQGTIPSAPLQVPGTAVHCTTSQLEGHPFRVNGLLVTVTSVHVGGFTNFSLVFRIENTTAQFTTIAWKDLAVVSADGEQFVAYDDSRGNLSAPVQEARVAPGAHMEHGFTLIGSNVRLKFPAKLYFQDQLLAEFTN